MKKLILISTFSLFIYSCSKTESTDTVTPPVVIKLSGCDSITKGFLKNTSDTVRLVSCLSITGCDSIRLGILKPNIQDTLRLLSCINISENDAMRLGLITIGREFQGGIVAYFLQPGDPGYDANVKHGLIVAKMDQSNGIIWSPNRLDNVIDANYSAIGKGNSNTNAIITSVRNTIINYAALSTKTYGNEWFLPSKDELNKLYINKTAINSFSNGSYWSSTQYSGTAGYAVSQNFADGSQNNTRKDASLYVRAIKTF